MSSDFSVRSFLRDYTVSFVDDFAVPLARIFEQTDAVAVLDERVHRLYADRLDMVSRDHRVIVVEASEDTKTVAGMVQLANQLIDLSFRRDSTLVGIGGGVVQDLVAFTASILYRGVDWCFFPTTLLAQADSCIGSKSSINLEGRKNLLGTFYPPSEILIDPAFLDSLSLTDIRSGIGEILHYYIYADSPMYRELIDDYDVLISAPGDLLPHIRESLRIKRTVIESDERDEGERNKFNYGHTFGHAFETATKYAIPHGQAVTVGMDLANHISVSRGIMDPSLCDSLREDLLRNFPNYAWAKIDIDRYLDALRRDKKNVGQDLVCILARRPGELTKVRLPFDESLSCTVQSYLSEL